MRAYQEDLNLKINAGAPIIQIISPEYRRIHGCAVKAAKANNKDLYRWNNSEGLYKWDDLGPVVNEENKDKSGFKEENKDMKDPEEILEWFQDPENKNLILLMEDLHTYFDDIGWRRIMGRLRTMSRKAHGNTLLLSQPDRNLPTLLEKDVYVLDIPLPDKDLLVTVIWGVITELELSEEAAPEDDLEIIAEAALGLTDMEALITFKEIALSKGYLTREDIPEIVQRKEQIIKKSGILEYFHPREGFGDVGGLANLKKWLKTRKAGFETDARKFGMTPPKGVLLLGIQGCGKSLVAKAIASEWNLPLLKFDLGKVFGGIIGESEANIRRALNVAEAVSPSILWIDEIEKGLSGVSSSGQTDSGTTARVFGTMLTWMQEKEKPVFVIATANNIDKMPPELLRKGRFDEIFFVDLPGAKSREDIWKIHLKKRLVDGRFKKAKLDLKRLSRESKGYSGAEIEEAINEALYNAYDRDDEVKVEDLVEVINKTYPLSKVMVDRIDDIRLWAKARARRAGDEEVEAIEKPKENVPILRQERANPFI